MRVEVLGARPLLRRIVRRSGIVNFLSYRNPEMGIWDQGDGVREREKRGEETSIRSNLPKNLPATTFEIVIGALRSENVGNWRDFSSREAHVHASHSLLHCLIEIETQILDSGRLKDVFLEIGFEFEAANALDDGADDVDTCLKETNVSGVFRGGER